MPDFSLPQANTQVVQSFNNLNGTSSQFVLPYGFYWLTFGCSDTNNPPTVSVIDAGSGNTLMSSNLPIPPSNPARLLTGGQFQTIGNVPIYVTTTGLCTQVTIEG